MNFEETLMLIAVWLLWFVAFYIVSKKQSKTLIYLSEEVSADLRELYLLNDYDRLETFCPEAFRTDACENKLRENLWFAFSVSSSLSVVWFCVHINIVNNGVLFLGWPIHHILWASLLLVSSISIFRSMIRSFRTYPQKIVLGFNPLLPKSKMRTMQFFVLISIVVTVLAWNLFPQNNLEKSFTLISLIEFAIYLLIGDLSQIVITNEGILYQRKLHDWGNISWYRWYNHRQGVLVGIEPGGFQSGFLIILPVNTENYDELHETARKILTGQTTRRHSDGTLKNLQIRDQSR